MADFTQEAFIQNSFGHYRNGIFGDPHHQPKWLMDGIALLSHIVNVEEARQLERSRG